MNTKNRKPLLTEEDLNPENVRIRISMMIQEDLLDSYRAEAARMGIPYQTLMQMKLREGLDNSVQKRLDRIEKALSKKSRSA